MITELVENTRKSMHIIHEELDAGGLQEMPWFGILLQRVIADFLSVMPPPFLGVSSLNLAAPTRSGLFSGCGLSASRSVRGTKRCGFARGNSSGGTSRKEPLLRKKREARQICSASCSSVSPPRKSATAQRRGNLQSGYSAAKRVPGRAPPMSSGAIATRFLSAAVSRARTFSYRGPLTICSSSRYSVLLTSICSA